MPPDLFDTLTQLAGPLRDGLLHLFLPAGCYVCGAPLDAAARHFCDTCRKTLFSDPQSACPHCAATIGPHGAPDGYCPSCRDEHFAFTRVVRLGPYGGVLRDVILRLKHHSNEGLAELVGETWAQQAKTLFATLEVDAVVPIPLYWWRRWRRGYNQSAALAHGIASVLGLPLEMAWLRRIRNTPMQTRTSFTARRDNVRNAFRVRPSVSLHGRSLLLVDDVLTTGSTANEAARMLRKAGAKRVVVAALARAHS
jgi:ComF family protein